jgi:hypothetical protein
MLAKSLLSLLIFSKNQLLGIYPKEHKTGYNRDTCPLMFIAATMPSCGQPRCPTTDEWIKKMWQICTMEYFSVIQNNDVVWRQMNSIVGHLVK